MFLYVRDVNRSKSNWDKPKLYTSLGVSFDSSLSYPFSLIPKEAGWEKVLIGTICLYPWCKHSHHHDWFQVTEQSREVMWLGYFGCKKGLIKLSREKKEKFFKKEEKIVLRKMGFMITIHRHWPSTWKGARNGAAPGTWASLSSLREHRVPLFLSLSLLFSPLRVSSALSLFLLLEFGLASRPQSKYLGHQSLHLFGFCPSSCRLLFWLLFRSSRGQRVAAWPCTGCKS